MPAVLPSVPGSVAKLGGGDPLAMFGSTELEDAWITCADVLLINTPWNPVGTALTREELVDIVAHAEKKASLIISDEI